MLSSCFLDFSVGVGAFVIGMSPISSVFSFGLGCFEDFVDLTIIIIILVYHTNGQKKGYSIVNLKHSICLT